MRDGEAIIEIMLRRGIRPDVVCWEHLMSTVACQARAGVLTPASLGEYVYDPITDAERVIAMMERVQPRMWPDDQVLHSYLEAVEAAVERRCANVSHAWGVYAHFIRVQQSLVDEGAAPALLLLPSLPSQTSPSVRSAFFEDTVTGELLNPRCHPRRALLFCMFACPSRD